MPQLTWPSAPPSEPTFHCRARLFDHDEVIAKFSQAEYDLLCPRIACLHCEGYEKVSGITQP